MQLLLGKGEIILKKLLDDTGVWRQDTELKDHITEYFKKLFTSEIEQPNQDVLSLVKRRVSTEMNNALLSPYTADDVRKALFDIGDLKAEGLMGSMLFSIKGFGQC